jgi:type IV pilus assembly protein PilM
MVNVGVVLGYSGLIIVVAKGISGRNYKVLKYGKENYGDGVTRKSKEFPEILKNILNKYLHGNTRNKIWCTIQSKGVETRFLVIPDIPAKHVAKAVFWAFKKEVEITTDDVVFDYDILGVRENQGKKEIEILACSAPQSELDDIKTIFQKTGRRLTGITVTSFAFQNLFRTGFEGENSKNIATLFIGADWSRIDIFSDGNLILSRDIKTGTRSLLEALDEKEEAHQESGITIDSYLEDGDAVHSGEGLYIDETPVNKEKIAPVIKDNFIDMIYEGSPESVEWIFNRILPVVDRLIRQMERTFEHFSLTTKGKRVERLYFTGPLCPFKKLLSYTGEQLGIPVLTINPFQYDGKMDVNGIGPREIGDQDEFVPATGLALSEPEHTLNFNFTFKDKERRRINKRITYLLYLLIALVLGGGLISHTIIRIKQEYHDASIKQLTQDLVEKEKVFGKPIILSFSDSIAADKKRLNLFTKNMYGAAILTEICNIIPENIKLNYFLYEDSQDPDKKRNLRIQGVVLCPALEAQKILDPFVERLKGSKLVKQVSISRSGETELEGEKVYYFEAGLELYE